MLGSPLGARRLLFCPVGAGQIRPAVSAETAIIYDPYMLYLVPTARYFHPGFDQTWMAHEIYAQTLGGA